MTEGSCHSACILGTPNGRQKTSAIKTAAPLRQGRCFYRQSPGIRSGRLTARDDAFWVPDCILVLPFYPGLFRSCGAQHPLPRHETDQISCKQKPRLLWGKGLLRCHSPGNREKPGQRQQVCSMLRGDLRLLLSLLDYHSFPGFELFDSSKAMKYSKTSAWEPSFHLTAASPGTPAEPKGCHHSITPEGYFQIFCSEQGKTGSQSLFPLVLPFLRDFLFL